MELSHSIFKKHSTTKYSNEEIIDVIKSSNETFKKSSNGTYRKSSKEIFEYIYENYYPKIRGMIWSCRNRGLQPEDIFQEGLIRVVMNIQNGKFRDKSSFFTYLRNTCINVCKEELRKKQHTGLSHDIEMKDESRKFELFKALITLKNSLGENCKNIIDIRLNLNNSINPLNSEDLNKEILFEDVARQLDISPENARQRYKRCLEKLRKIVMNDSGINDYYL